MEKVSLEDKEFEQQHSSECHVWNTKQVLS